MVDSKEVPFVFKLNSSLLRDENSTSLPSLKIALTAKVWSRVDPYSMEVEPQELFPTIPPIVQRLAVDVLGPKKKP